MSQWHCIDDLRPEDCSDCHFYNDSHISITTVLCMDKNGRMEIRNRLYKRRTGIPYIDTNSNIPLEQWVWSQAYIIKDEDIFWWLPIPKMPDYHSKEESA